MFDVITTWTTDLYVHYWIVECKSMGTGVSIKVVLKLFILDRYKCGSVVYINLMSCWVTEGEIYITKFALLKPVRIVVSHYLWGKNVVGKVLKIS